MWWMTLWEQGWPSVQWGATISAALAAMCFDLRQRRIPNALTGPLLLAGVGMSFYVGGPAGLADAAAGCVVLALPYVLLFVFAGGGAGDAKLMGALGAWLGVVNGLIVLLAVALSGVVLGLGYAVVAGRFRDVLDGLRGIVVPILLAGKRLIGLRESRDMMPPRETMLTMPYAVAIFFGVCIAAGGSCLWHG